MHGQGRGAAADQGRRGLVPDRAGGGRRADSGREDRQRARRTPADRPGRRGDRLRHRGRGRAVAADGGLRRRAPAAGGRAGAQRPRDGPAAARRVRQAGAGLLRRAERAAAGAQEQYGPHRGDRHEGLLPQPRPAGPAQRVPAAGRRRGQGRRRQGHRPALRRRRPRGRHPGHDRVGEDARGALLLHLERLALPGVHGRQAVAVDGGQRHRAARGGQGVRLPQPYRLRALLPDRRPRLRAGPAQRPLVRGRMGPAGRVRRDGVHRRRSYAAAAPGAHLDRAGALSGVRSTSSNRQPAVQLAG
ncbi:hypothetical protein SBRY_20491 [Actinacidiphila bryophytorum]|uniref:Uncharacterized protein n=1 Tax=Actinacidiphila bryophytorum TaxID=1436133 RepID=A0A9W4GZ48_9ACTN|nr:hypothetical protein SBRY_20491 [Actinacidiphila bryophytorum]